MVISRTRKTNSLTRFPILVSLGRWTEKRARFALTNNSHSEYCSDLKARNNIVNGKMNFCCPCIRVMTIIIRIWSAYCSRQFQRLWCYAYVLVFSITSHHRQSSLIANGTADASTVHCMYHWMHLIITIIVTVAVGSKVHCSSQKLPTGDGGWDWGRITRNCRIKVTLIAIFAELIISAHACTAYIVS